MNTKPNEMEFTLREDSTMAELPHWDFALPPTVQGIEAAEIFDHNPRLPGIMVIAPGSIGVISRERFYDRLGRRFGIEIFYNRPLQVIMSGMKSDILHFSHDTPIRVAAEACLNRAEDSTYEPLVVTFRDRPPRLVGFRDLIVAQTRLIAIATQVAETQRKAADAANASKSQFLANMSHELRTPLTAILGYSEIVLEDLGAGAIDEAVPRVKKINSAGRHLLELINGVLDISKIEAGRMDLFLESFDVRKVVHDVTELLTPLVQKNKNQMELIFLNDPGLMHSDLIKVRQNLYNLISNAAKFTQQGRISVTLQRETISQVDWLEFRVADTGIGLSGEQISRLFQPFVQADFSTTRKYGGTGLGLVLIRHFCEMMGGSIAVESQPGQGSTFTMRLPAEIQAETEKEMPRSFE